jgi:2-phospho-L-lactate guanylyltransferase
VIVPDRHGDGTNALLLTPPDALTPSFGEASRQRHFDLAVAQGSVPEVIEVPSLALDIDTPEDLEVLQAALAANRGGAAHTRGMLNQMARTEAR